MQVQSVNNNKQSFGFNNPIKVDRALLKHFSDKKLLRELKNSERLANLGKEGGFIVRFKRAFKFEFDEIANQVIEVEPLNDRLRLCLYKRPTTFREWIKYYAGRAPKLEDVLDAPDEATVNIELGRVIHKFA